MPTNIKDVAKEAGVSITTVSRVLNNNYPVKKETRENIEKAIEKLNYKPNVMARSLITKKTGVIGVIIPSITNLFFPTIVEAVEEYIRTKGYNITLCNTHGDNKEEKELVEKVISRQVDGIIVIDPTPENVKNGLYEKLSKTIPLIIVSGSYENSKCNFVCYDQTVGTEEAFQYLLELGHRKIAFLIGHKSYSYDIKEKIYKNILEGENIEYEKIINAGKGNSLQVVEKSEEQIKQLLENEERPTAIFACNDLKL
jgi:LacI family transcriptional regulator